MAQGRSRNSKRPSSSSYASTITTMVFVAMCVVGLWMLTSSSVLPTPTTAHSISDPSSSSGSVTIKSPLFPSKQDSEENENPPPFEDRSGDLSDDVDGGEKSTPATKELDQQELQNKLIKNEQDSDSEEKTEQTMGEESDENRNFESETQEMSNDDSIKSDENDAGEQSTPAAKEVDQQRDDEEKKNESIQNAQVSDSEKTTEQTMKEEGEENRNSESETLEMSNEAIENQNQRSDEEEKQSSEEIEKNEIDEDDEMKTEKDEKEQESEIQDNLQESENIQQLKEDQETPLEGDKQETQQPANSAESNSGIPKEGWRTQADESEEEKERRKEESMYGYTWQLCNVTAGSDYIPCLDNEKVLKYLHTTGHFEHRERHCPEVGPTCLVPLPERYKTPIQWPTSRDKIWYHNVPHTKLAEVKGHQNWVKVSGEFLTFPGGGTQFIHGALHYIDFIQQTVRKMAWGSHTRVILDVGCGVASFGGYLFDRNVLAMSFAPKDEHEAQVQFALERGIPAISAVMGSKRLPFPSSVFDLVHCARCRVPWHAEGGLLLLELNRVLRPGGYFVWSATPVYQKLKEDVEIWKAMSSLTASMCWELVAINKDKLNSIGAAIYRKPSSNQCYDQRKQKRPPMCESDDDPNAAWYVPLQACMHRVPVDKAERGTRWPENWPRRLQMPPYWLNNSKMGIYGRPAPQDFAADYEHWKQIVNKTYINGLGISMSNVRNVMDMRSTYGGFAAALKDLLVWVMNVVNIDSPDTLPIIYERGLLGIYHDWCESFSTYPRTYDLLHADHLFSKLKKRCKLGPVMAEVDRIVRPGGNLIVRDESSTIEEVKNLLKSLHWEVHLTFSKNQEGLLSAQKGDWRPETYSDS